ncbi:MAG: right-handed parallel beta-helix repeat-containing protein [Gammaproteobacteria bacterium]|nr:right-handed parallel beta-helix repeat-containing protein [Gammaproteobacteria bacterium]
MGKKLGLVIAAIALLVAGAIGGMKFAGDNRDTVVGDSARYRVEATSGSALTRSVGGSGTGAVHEVRDGDSIQVAVAAAQSGDIIKIFPGTYHETVYIDKDDIVLSGVVIDDVWPVMEGESKLNDAVLYSGNDITVENLQIQHYKGNAIMGQAGNNFLIRNNRIVDTGVYGIFPEFGTNGLVTHNVLSGIEDAAIYIGMCDNIHVAHNEVFNNVAGIEIENTRHSIVENNYAHDNTGGILVFITPGLPIKTTFDTIVRNNFVVNNNTPNFGIPGSTVSGIPAGTGILNMAGDQTTIEGNIITGNQVIGILITDHMNAANVTLDPDADPNSDEISILDNMMWNNGYQPIPEITALKTLELVDGDVQILNVGNSRNSCILDHDKYVTVGLRDFGTCGFTTTAAVTTYLLDEPAARREIAAEDMGKRAYYGICAGCHSYSVKMIGPPTQIIQALYADDPQGIVDYITSPSKKRDDYPEMPPQNYLSEDVRMAAAEFMLQVKK